MNVYIAAPLFSATERQFNVELAQKIQSYCQVHLPQRDGPLIEEEIARGVHAAEASRSAFTSDMAAIRRCDVLVAVLDGRIMDEGVCVEVGIAAALRKMVVGLKSDARCALPWGNNPMIDGCVGVWVRNSDELGAWIQSCRDSGLQVLRKNEDAGAVGL